MSENQRPGAKRNHVLQAWRQQRFRFPSPGRIAESHGDFNQDIPMTRQLPRFHFYKRVSLLPTAALMAGLLVLAGCATTPPAPEQALQAAEIAIGNAERNRAPEFAAPELIEARAKLTAARNAARNEQMVQAKRLAEQSLTDAELASAKADFVQASAINDEMKKSIDAMQQEMQRNQGARR